MRELREKGEIDSMVYGKIKADMGAIKKQDVVPRAFPSKADEMKKPEQAIKVGNALYTTSSMDYGGTNPAA